MRTLILGIALAACGSPPRPSTAPRTAPPAVTESQPAAPVDLAAAEEAFERAEEAIDGWRFADAVKDLEIAAPVFEAQLPETDERRETVMSRLTRAYRFTADWAKARSTANRWIARSRKRGDRSAEADGLNGLGLVVQEAGDPRGAIVIYEQALAIDTQLGRDDDHTDKSTRLHNLALAYGHISEYGKAIALLERVLARDVKISPTAVGTANTMHNLALQLRDDGQYERAKQLFGQALQIQLTELGSRHPRLAPTLNGLGGTHKMLKDYDKAVRMYLEVVAITSGQQRSDSRAIALSELGEIETDRKHVKEALRYFDDALDLLVKIYPGPRGHSEIVRVLVKRVAAHLANRDLAQAERDTTNAIEMATKLGSEPPEETITWLADQWSAAGHAKRAKELRAQAEALQKP